MKDSIVVTIGSDPNHHVEKPVGDDYCSISSPSSSSPPVENTNMLDCTVPSRDTLEAVATSSPRAVITSSCDSSDSESAMVVSNCFASGDVIVTPNETTKKTMTPAICAGEQNPLCQASPLAVTASHDSPTSAVVDHQRYETNRLASAHSSLAIESLWTAEETANVSGESARLREPTAAQDTLSSPMYREGLNEAKSKPTKATITTEEEKRNIIDTQTVPMLGDAAEERRQERTKKNRKKSPLLSRARRREGSGRRTESSGTTDNASDKRSEKTRLQRSLRTSNSTIANATDTQSTHAPSANVPSSNLPVPKSHVTNNGNGHHCIIHNPTLQELESLNSFGSYVRDVVLQAANTYEIDKNHPQYAADFYMETKMELCEGMALLRLPRKGFGCSRASVDRTGRGDAWNAGTVLGDWPIESPIEQHVRGMAGVYEYTFVDKPPMTMSEFRDRADTYKQQQIGNSLNRINEQRKTKQKEDATAKAAKGEVSKEQNQPAMSANGVVDLRDNDQNDNNNADKNNSGDDDTMFVAAEDDIDLLERQFWKRIGPTMIPAWYGADQEDSMFLTYDEIDKSDPSQFNPAASWSLSQLDSCLQVLPPIPGVTSPYLYVGMWGSVFCAHTEDMNLLSINYLHAGSPKYWYSIAEPDAIRFLSLAEHYYAREAGKCKEFLRHKRYLLSPAVLQKAGIRYQVAVQYPGDAVITMPGGYHFGFNTGFNVAEATNFGVPEWLPFGREAKVCLCRPDSVRIDMYRLTLLIQQFHKDQKRNRRLSFVEWRRKRDWGKKIRNTSSASTCYEVNDGETNSRKRKRMNGSCSNSNSNNVKLSEQQRKNEFWVEVMKPISSDLTKSGEPKKKTKKKKGSKKKNICRGTTGEDSTTSGKRDSKKKPVDIWHLAKPINRTSNRVLSNSRVLCIIPASQNLQQLNLNAASMNDDNLNENLFFNRKNGEKRIAGDDDDFDALDEQCFAGQVVELQDDFARIHLVGLPRTEDIWMSIHSPRLFLDGGQWNHAISEEMIPPLHYWQEMDSKKLLST